METVTTNTPKTLRQRGAPYACMECEKTHAPTTYTPSGLPWPDMGAEEKRLSNEYDAYARHKDRAQGTPRGDALGRLREWLKPGMTVYTILRHRGRSGMMRHISLLITDTTEGNAGRLVDISGYAALAMGMNRADDGGIKAGGCGMDMGFHLVYNLGRTLFNEWACTGRECPANDHANARREYCPMCGKDNPKRVKHTRPSRGWDAPVCSKACADVPWMHRDGGYALRHSWI